MGQYPWEREDVTENRMPTNIMDSTPGKETEACRFIILSFKTLSSFLPEQVAEAVYSEHNTKLQQKFTLTKLYYMFF